MSKWQPIETAPKDGRQILGYTCAGDYVVVEFYTKSDGTSGWEIAHHRTDDGVWRLVCSDTLVSWQPLPEPPATDNTGAE